MAIVEAWETGKMTLTDTLKQCEMGKTTFYRLLREYRILHPRKDVVR